ncbi:PREDICTED: F-box only protein 36-like [Priapulus caudatus]|uniref:F-box only protein 36-like n=1 Tax=Priapulus caudatus TaxID=37621 RepID=A0ABM1F081_PRICU|nr:PREDICTED: F-box only protein 36-like [Priapulus caudatus]
MASLIPDGVLLDASDQAPAPSKDFCQLYITTNDEVIWRWWKISLRNEEKLYPGELKDNYEDFLDDERIQNEIKRVFGNNMLEYVKGLVEGHIDYLCRLPRRALLHVVSLLDLPDISKIAQTSKQFQEICWSDDLWSILYHRSSNQPVTEEVESLAKQMGWRNMFFTNKLQLRVKLSQQKRRRFSFDDMASGSMSSTTFITQGDHNVDTAAI